MSETASLPELARTVEALLFLSADPLSESELAEATEASDQELAGALEVLSERYAPGRCGIRLRQLGGGFTLASDPAAEDAARRLFSRPRVYSLTPAQAETLAIVAYLQPISRPEITRIRGVSADSATATLLERGMIEEAGHSQFGAVLYRTSTQFLKLFGLRTLAELPDIARWDPTPEEEADLRERLLRAGAARAGETQEVESPPGPPQEVESPPGPPQEVESPPAPPQEVESPSAPPEAVESPPAPPEAVELSGGAAS